MLLLYNLILILFFILFYFYSLHCPLSGPDLTYISLLIIPCIIYHVTNKETLNLEVHKMITAEQSMNLWQLTKSNNPIWKSLSVSYNFYDLFHTIQYVRYVSVVCNARTCQSSVTCCWRPLLHFPLLLCEIQKNMVYLLISRWHFIIKKTLQWGISSEKPCGLLAYLLCDDKMSAWHCLPKTSVSCLAWRQQKQHKGA